MKDKIIEEMARHLCLSWKNIYDSCEQCSEKLCCSYFNMAEELVDAGYRKNPEGAVVLTREELEQIKGFSREEVDEISETAIKNSRKETAEKIFDKLYTWLDLEEIEKYGFVHIQKFDFLRKFREICKEITEG